MSFADVTKSITTSVEKHTPEILTGLGIFGMLATTVLAVKATPKALKLIEDKKKEKEEWSPKDTVKTAWKCYIPAASTAVISTACLIGSSRVSLKRNAALATAYKLVETASKEYREKVIETIGEKKEGVINDKIAQDKVNNNPVSNNQIIVTGNGNSLIYDSYSGRYFMADIELVKRAINKLNLDLRNENYISLNDFYSEIGLESTKLGDMLGWNIDQGLVDLELRPAFSENNQPCAVLDFSVSPKYEFYKMY